MSPPIENYTAFDVFVECCRRQFKKMDSNGTAKMPLESYMRYTTDHWKDMSYGLKHRFQIVADQLRSGALPANYFELMSFVSVQDQVLPTMAAPVINKRKRPAKDRDAPKKPMTPFFWYSQEHRDEIRKEQPDIPLTVVAKELGKMWKDLTADQKRRYEEMYENDKKRYEQEYTEYKKRKMDDSSTTPNVVPMAESEESTCSPNVGSLFEGIAEGPNYVITAVEDGVVVVGPNLTE